MVQSNSIRLVRRVKPLLVQLASIALVCTAASADTRWPSEPESPLALGHADTFVIAPHLVTDDGATWVAWIDDICLGDIRVQRIDPSGSVMAPGGLILPKIVELCGSMEMMLAGLADGSVIVHAAMPNTGMPLHRIAADGTLLWGKGLMAPWLGGLRAALGLDDGGVLLGGNAGASMIVSRHAVDGTTMWTTEIPTNHTSNIRVLGLVPDNDGGAFLVWDKPLTYTRMILAAHVTEAGISSWSEPLVVVPPDPSSSRHTEPVAIADGVGGVVVIFTKGTETAHAPVPLLMQHFDVKGELTFTPQGARVSLDTERQYNAIVMRDDATNDITIVYRSGPFADQSVRAQRMTLSGDRLWGDTGVAIADLGVQGTSYFDAVMTGKTLSAIVSKPTRGSPSVNVYRVDGSGVVVPVPIAISGETDAMMVKAAATGNAMTVSWFERNDGNEGDLVGQHVNADGTLGLTVSDLDHDGDVDAADLAMLLGAWGPCNECDDCHADLNNDCTVDAADLALLLGAWG